MYSIHYKISNFSLLFSNIKIGQMSFLSLAWKVADTIQWTLMYIVWEFKDNIIAKESILSCSLILNCGRLSPALFTTL